MALLATTAPAFAALELNCGAPRLALGAVFNPWNGYQPPWGEAQKTAFNPWGSYMPPWENLQTVNRDNKGDREPATFADRFDAVKDLDPKSMPALHKWMVEHGIVGGAAVAADDE
jgi:hypothetical protein